MRKIFLLMMMVFIGRSLAGLAVAQEGGGLSSRQDEFFDLRSKVVRLLDDNRKLQAEDERLLLQKQILQEKVDQMRREMSGFSDRMSAATDEGQAKSRSIIDLQEELKKLHAAAVDKKSQNEGLRARLKDIDEKRDVKELKLKNLEYQKEDLDVTLEALRKDYDVKLAPQKGLIEALQEELTQLEQKKQAIEDEQRKIDEIGQDLPARLPALQAEVAALLAAAADLTSKKALAEKENSLWKDKKLLAEKMYERDAAPLVTRQQTLEVEVARLEQEYNDLAVKIETFKASQENGRQLVDELMRLDKENRELKKKAGLILDENR